MSDLSGVEERLAERLAAHPPMPDAAERRRLRKQAGLSLHEMGLVVGCTGTTVSRWELDNRAPAHRLRAPYAQALRLLAEREARAE